MKGFINDIIGSFIIFITTIIITLVAANILESDTYFPFAFRNYDVIYVPLYYLILDILWDSMFLVIYLYLLRIFILKFVYRLIFKENFQKGWPNYAIFGTFIILYIAFDTLKFKMLEVDRRLKKYVFKEHLIPGRYKPKRFIFHKLRDFFQQSTFLNLVGNFSYNYFPLSTFNIFNIPSSS